MIKTRRFQVVAKKGIERKRIAFDEKGEAVAETFVLAHQHVLIAYGDRDEEDDGHVTTWLIHGPFPGEFTLSDIELAWLIGDYLREI